MFFLLDDNVPTDILEMVGAHCATGIKNIGTLESLERRNVELLSINTITSKASSSLELRQILDVGVSEVKGLFGADATAIYLLDQAGQVLCLDAYCGMPEAAVKRSKCIQLGISTIGKFFTSGSDLLVGDLVDYSDEFPHYRSLTAKQTSILFATAVLHCGGQHYGLLTIVRSGKDSFTNKEQSLLLSIANQLSVAIENASLHRDVVESEEKLRLTIESVAEGITVTNLEGKIIKVNDAVIKMHGYENKERLIGLSSVALITKKEHAKAKQYLKKTMETSDSGPIEYTFVRKDGSEFLAELNASLIKDASGKPLGFVASTRDITERRRAETMLRESERKYRLITDSTTDYISLLTFKGKYTYLSPSIQELGYQPEELLGKSGFDYIHPDDRKRLLPLLVKYAALKIKDLMGLKQESFSENIDFRFRDKYGGWHYMEATANLVNALDGDGLNILLTSRDMTERKKAEFDLTAHKELIDRILATTPNSVVVVGKDTEVRLANRAFYDGFKKRREEVEGKPIDEIIPVEELSKLVSKALVSKARHLDLEFRHRLNGHDRILIASILPMQSEEALLILNDVTDERERQERLYLTNRMASVGEMASGIAHELNNPLTSVIGLSQLLIGEDMPEDTREDVEAIYSEAQRAAAVVKNLLTFARKHAPERQLTQINRVLEDVLKLRAYEHKVNNIEVNTKFDTELPEIMADYFQIQQVFLNIVLNAESAMTEAHGKGTLTITTEREGGNIKVSLTDDGIGIPKGHLGRLFDPFFTTKEVGKGTGLGLSICYGIVTGHGGTLYAQSTPGHGATFFIKLPIKAK